MSAKKLEPLKISCTSTDCEKNLHCFRAKRVKRGQRIVGGKCHNCGIELVDWGRIHRRDLNDFRKTFEYLKKELIRHEFWHRKIDEKAIEELKRKGKKRIYEEVEKRLIKAVKPENPWRGGFTPYHGKLVYYAQHATASCCRKCMEYWHNIEQGEELNENEIAYLTKLIHLYMDDRFDEFNKIIKVPE